MKASPLLIEPEITRGQAKDQSSPALGIAVIQRGIDIKPDMIHVGKVTAQLANHLVAGAFGAEPRAFHNFCLLKPGPVLQNHVEFRVESSRSDHHSLAVNLDRFVLMVCRCDATDAVILYE